MRVVGIDPGTKTIDVCLLNDGRVISEAVIDSKEVATKPELLIKVVEKFSPYDIIVGPSGYGVEVTYIDEIPEEFFEEWYYTYVLLTSRSEIEEGVRRGDVGSYIYYAMAKTVKEFKRRGLPVVFIPGVINLPTIPEHRKLNRVDLGTADKLALAVLAVLMQSRRLRIPYSETSFILVELGFGYNSAVGVREGLVIDAFGGTSMPGPSFLTMGCADLEVVQLIKSWVKTDVFTGGASYISGCASPEELVECYGSRAECRDALNSMIEGVLKSIHALTYTVGVPREIIYSGRLVRVKLIKEALINGCSKSGVLSHVNAVAVGNLPGASVVKETAQGYAVVGDGIVGGVFNDLIKHMRIKEARGSAVDYVRHPKFRRDAFPRFKR
ncbi:MAG: DUF1464 family protein [Zestosphaera sp.]